MIIPIHLKKRAISPQINANKREEKQKHIEFVLFAFFAFIRGPDGLDFEVQDKPM